MRRVIQIVILTLIVGCNDQYSTKESTTRVDTTSYSYEGFNHYRNLSLLSNKNFSLRESSSSCFGDYKAYTHSGNYIETDSTIKLFPKIVEIESYNTITELDTTYKVPYSDSLIIKTTYHKFKWDKKQYLLSEEINNVSYPGGKNDYEKFAYSYNIGQEPEDSGDYLTREIDSIDSLSTQLNIKKLPKEYQDIFLNKPISSYIIERKKIIIHDEEFDDDLVKWRVKIDKGFNDGLRKGMRLITRDNEFFIHIDSLKKSYSYGECYVYNIEPKHSEIGTELRTRWKK